MPEILTIGHSTLALPGFLGLLQSHRVGRVVDVRTAPGSRRHPQFNRESLARALAEAGVGYSHWPGLGGLRRPRPDSPNAAWRHAGFRGFADYMQTAEFETNLAGMIDLGRQERIALMCAEAVPWRCHRSLIADALLARGMPVTHITGATRAAPHRLTPFARVEGGRVTYPPAG